MLEMLSKSLIRIFDKLLGRGRSFTAGKKPLRLALVDDETLDEIIRAIEARQRERMGRSVTKWRRRAIKAIATVVMALALSVLGNWVYAHLPSMHGIGVPERSSVLAQSGTGNAAKLR
jgi:hypothetical protein